MALRSTLLCTLVLPGLGFTLSQSWQRGGSPKPNIIGEAGLEVHAKSVSQLNDKLPMPLNYLVPVAQKGRLDVIGAAGAFQLSKLPSFRNQALLAIQKGRLHLDASNASRLDKLPRPFNYFASVVEQDKLYLLGGFDSVKRLDDVFVFDSGRWSRAPSMRTERDDFGAAMFRGKLHVAGGFDGDATQMSPVSTMEVLDGTSWDFGPPMREERAGFGLVPYRDRLYALGGYTPFFNGTSSVEVFDGQTWKLGPSMPIPMWGVAAVVFQDRLVVLGGVSSIWTPLPTNTMMIFDGASWSFGPPMPYIRSYMGAAVFQGKLYAMGGAATCCNDGAASNTVMIFDGARWESGQPMKEARTCFRVEVFQGRLLALGGNSMMLLDSTEVIAGPQHNATEAIKTVHAL